MSLLGIDVGTTGCKVAVFSLEGRLLASAYEEYDVIRRQPGWAELDARDAWRRIKHLIGLVAGQAAHQSPPDPVQAISIASLGEAVVPVSEGREILATSLLNFDARGEEYLPKLKENLPTQMLAAINGNTLGNHYSLTKLLWMKDHLPEVYANTAKFLHWSGWLSFMLGAEPVVDYSLANRSLLLDLDRKEWSAQVAGLAGLDLDKMPRLVPSGTPVGIVSGAIARELGLQENVVIVSGAHDQCANAVGCGVIDEGSAVLGMGTYLCITPVFGQRKDPEQMSALGLNTEHHAVPGYFVSFIYNVGGALVKWYRDTFAEAEKKLAQATGADIYAQLFSEIPESNGASSGPLIVLPHFAPTGPPHFLNETAGVIAGLKLETSRPEILRAVVEGIMFYLRETIDCLPAIGIQIDQYRAVGGGSKSERWVQICADIFGKPVVRPQVSEAGSLGAAILAGVGAGRFSSFAEGVQEMVKMDRTFEPDPHQQELYEVKYGAYKQLYPLLADYLKNLSRIGKLP